MRLLLRSYLQQWQRLWSPLLCARPASPAGIGTGLAKMQPGRPPPAPAAASAGAGIARARDSAPFCCVVTTATRAHAHTCPQGWEGNTPHPALGSQSSCSKNGYASYPDSHPAGDQAEGFRAAGWSALLHLSFTSPSGHLGSKQPEGISTSFKCPGQVQGRREHSTWVKDPLQMSPPKQSHPRCTRPTPPAGASLGFPLILSTCCFLNLERKPMLGSIALWEGDHLNNRTPV